MANPQPENGYSRIANEILEALAMTHLSPNEVRVLWVIIRQTYGWGKKSNKLPVSQISEMTGLHKENVSRSLKNLKSRLIVIATDNKRIGLNKNYDQWLSIPITNKAKYDQILPSTPEKKVINIDNKKLSISITNQSSLKKRKKETTTTTLVQGGEEKDKIEEPQELCRCRRYYEESFGGIPFNGFATELEKLVETYGEEMVMWSLENAVKQGNQQPKITYLSKSIVNHKREIDLANGPSSHRS